MSGVHLVAVAITALYGLISLVGGVMGYVRAGSVISLVAGGIAGVLLLVCAAGAFRSPFWAFLGAIVLAILLLGQFAPSVVRAASGGTWNDLVSQVRGVVALVMTVGGVLVVIFAVWALLTEARPPAGS